MSQDVESLRTAGIAHARRALAITTKKPAPDRIPLSVPEKVRARDYYTATFEMVSGKRGFLVDEVVGDDVSGRWVSHTAEPEAASINLAELAPLPLEIRQYFGELEIVYDSPREFWWHHHLRIPRLKLARLWISNRIYARRLLLRADRMEILQRLLDYDIQERSRISTMDVMNDLHGPRWPAHPQAMAAYRYAELLLESLVQSGDLETDNGSYRIKPKAIETIVRHDVENRRHRDNASLQRWVVILTVVLVAIGAVQAYAALQQVPETQTNAATSAVR